MANNFEDNPKYGEVISYDELEENPKVNKLISKQFKLSFSISLIILFVSFLIPTLNRFAPNLMDARIFGYNLYYFVTALGIYPFVWALTIYYTKRSITLEKEELVGILEDQKQGHIKEDI